MSCFTNAWTMKQTQQTIWRHISSAYCQERRGKICGGVEVYLHSFLTRGLDGGEWSTSRAGHVTVVSSLTDFRLDRRLLGEIRRRYGHSEEQKNLLAPAGYRSQDRPALEAGSLFRLHLLSRD